MLALPPLPNSPGCYLFSDEDNRIIYIGKAKNLKKRVLSYFQKRDHDQKTALMIEAISSIDYIVTGNEVEALILENNLIKAHQPRYNIDLKDAKQYAFIEITHDPFPAIRVSRKRGGDGSFFGPFVSAAERDYLFRLLKRVFRLRTCNRITRRSCLRYHIHTCSAPCRGMINSGEYAEQVRKAILVLKGKTAELIAALKKEMDEKAKDLEFEQALIIRNQIQALEKLSRHQDIARIREGNEDIINYHIHDGSVYLMLFHVHKGTLAHKTEFVFGYSEDFFEEFLVQYYSENSLPAELILPVGAGEPVMTFLSMKAGKKVALTVPKQGAKKRLLDLVAKNIETVFFGDSIKVDELQEALLLDTSPHVIECFDISHISGTSIVGSMVQFRNGSPDKKNYRRFRVKTIEGSDDPKALAEVISRRYSRLRTEGLPIPDLIMVDGGRGQLSAALEQLKVQALGIPVIALAKKNEEIYLPGRASPLRLDRNNRALLYLQEIRDEAHRFALQYHHLLRKKEAIA